MSCQGRCRKVCTRPSGQSVSPILKLARRGIRQVHASSSLCTAMRSSPSWPLCICNSASLHVSKLCPDLSYVDIVPRVDGGWNRQFIQPRSAVCMSAPLCTTCMHFQDERDAQLCNHRQGLGSKSRWTGVFDCERPVDAVMEFRCSASNAIFVAVF